MFNTTDKNPNFYVDISKYCNHSVYENDECRGISCFFLTEKLQGLISCPECEFKIFSSARNDNIKCDGQKIFISPLKIKKIAFLGYSEYGTVKDAFILHTATSSIKEEFVFKTYQTNNFQGIDDSEINKKSIPVRCLRGSDGQLHNIYSWIVNISCMEEITHIELPINLPLHIMAITLITQ